MYSPFIGIALSFPFNMHYHFHHSYRFTILVPFLGLRLFPAATNDGDLPVVTNDGNVISTNCSNHCFKITVSGVFTTRKDLPG